MCFVIRAFTGEYIGNYILGTLVGLAGMIFLYIIRAVGAGDVKLLAVIGMLTGLEFVLQLMVVSLITGLFTGIVELFLKKTRERMGRAMKKAHGFHYAVGVLADMLLCWYTGVLWFYE